MDPVRPARIRAAFFAGGGGGAAPLPPLNHRRKDAAVEDDRGEGWERRASRAVAPRRARRVAEANM